MTTDNADFSRYGKRFQETLAQMILDDRPFCDQMEEVLNINFFELKYLQVFTSIVFNYRKEFGTHPTKEIISSIMKSGLEDFQPHVQKQVRDYFSVIMVRNLQDQKYIKETALDFCKKQKLKEALMKSVDLIQSSSYDQVKL